MLRETKLTLEPDFGYSSLCVQLSTYADLEATSRTPTEATVRLFEDGKINEHPYFVTEYGVLGFGIFFYEIYEINAFDR